MNVLFLMISFQDLKENPLLYTDLAEEFYKQGHSVYVATILENKYGKETRFKNEYGINVLRIHSGDMFNVNMIRKGFTTLSLPHIFKKNINKYFKNIKFDLVIYPTPPITFAPVVSYIKKKDNCKTYLILRDIFPQNAVDLGIMKNKLIYYYFRRKEKLLYKVSDQIGCMSQGNIDYILKHNKVEPSKLKLLYNWTRIAREAESGEVVDIRTKYNWDNKVIAVYGGNIGIPQELEFLIELIKEYKSRDEVRFLIIGKGTESKRIRALIESENLNNVVMADYIKSSQYDDIVRQCDIGLVNLNRNFTIPNFPYKTISYFKCKLPVLAAIDKNTDYGSFIEEVGAGLCCYTGDLDSYTCKFEKLVADVNLRESLGNNGHRFLISNLDVLKAYKAIVEGFNFRELSRVIAKEL